MCVLRVLCVVQVGVFAMSRTPVQRTMSRTPVQRTPADCGASLDVFEGPHTGGRGPQDLSSREKQIIIVRHCVSYFILLLLLVSLLVARMGRAEGRCVQGFGGET